MSLRWLEYTRNQRIGLIVMLALVIVAFTLSALFPPASPLASVSQTDSIRFLNQVNDFKKQLIPKVYTSTNSYHHANLLDEKVLSFEFDPNVADSLTLRALGIKPFVIRNIQKYLAKGGRFRSSADFSRLYGIDTLTFNRLEPFLSFQSQITDTLIQPPFNRIDLNRADTLMLQSIPGIGPYYARTIVSYRTKLGGFVSLSQLYEIKALPMELTDQIEHLFTLSLDSIQRLPINKASLDRLRAHPYVNFYQARTIYETRRTHGQFDSLPQLLLSNDFSEEWLEKIELYLDFTKFNYNRN